MFGEKDRVIGGPRIAPRRWIPAMNLNAKLGDGASTPLDLVALQVNTAINQSLPTVAEHTVVMTFHNKHPKVLEGELVFTLPEGATVHGYGLDVNGVIVDGVVVEKEKARVSFETEVRKGVDPGIVEWVGGNTFRTRVYPLFANGRRTVKIAYMSHANYQEDASILHTLPVSGGKGLEKLSITCTVSNAIEGVVGATVSQNPFGKDRFEFATRGGQAVATCTIDRVPNVDFTVEVALSTMRAVVPGGASELGPLFALTQWGSEDDEEPAPAAAHGVGGFLKEAFMNFGGGGANRAAAAPAPDAIVAAPVVKPTQTFFAIGDCAYARTQLPSTGPRPAGGAFGGVKRVWIYWDASLSRAQGDRSAELNVITQLMQKWQDVSVRLMALRDSVEEGSEWNVARGDARALVNAIQSLPYDGATSFAQLTFPKADPRTGAQITCILLVSDGLCNLGELPENTGAPGGAGVIETPVHSIGNSAQANHGLLRETSERSGGLYCNLTDMKVEEAVNAIGAFEPAYQFLQLKYDPQQVSQVYPAHPVSMATLQGALVVTGVLLTPRAHVQVCYGFGSTVVQTRDVVLEQPARPDKTSAFPIAQRLWAEKKLNELMTRMDVHKDTLLDLGKRYGLVSPFTSFIVLESLQQHLTHKIRPAASRADMRKQYDQTRQKETQDEDTRVKQKWDSVATMWVQRMSWWNAPPRVEQQRSKGGRGGGGGSRRAFGSARGGDDEDGELLSEGGPSNSFAFDMGAASSGFSFMADTAVASGSAFPPPPPPAQAPMPQSAPMRPSAPMARMREEARESAPRSMAKSKKMSSGSGGGGGGLREAAKAMDMKEEANDALGAGAGTPAGGAIAVQKWDPNTPYLKQLKNTRSELEAYGVYLEHRTRYRNSPSFYFDVSSFFFDKQYTALGIRILTCIMELSLESAQLLRIVGYKLTELKQFDMAIQVFNQVLRLRGEEPQSYRDLALLLADKGDFNRSVELFVKVLTGKWDARFNEIEVTALTELNHLIYSYVPQGGVANADAAQRAIAFVQLLQPKLRSSLPAEKMLAAIPMDLRISLAWDTDSTDVDLHVVEPNGEECYYSHKNTAIGGAISRDFTQGYGPEEYFLRKAIPGVYKIRAKYFGSHQQSLTGATTLLITIWKFYGWPGIEQKILTTVRLTSDKEILDVASVEFTVAEMRTAHQAQEAKVATNVVHEGVGCDNCGGKVVGARYKCMVCVNIDFCEKCEAAQTTNAAGHTNEHPLLKLRDSKPYANWPMLMNREQWKHPFPCAGCKVNPIVGMRFMCSTCGTHFCEYCEARGVHDVRHTKLKFTVPQN